MELDCILDTCPKDGNFVNHITCCKCSLNPLGDKQPKFSCQLCNHPEAKHNPNRENWQNLKASGSEFLSIRLVK